MTCQSCHRRFIEAAIGRLIVYAVLIAVVVYGIFA
jgi:hypothetical protein